MDILSAASILPWSNRVLVGPGGPPILLLLLLRKYACSNNLKGYSSLDETYARNSYENIVLDEGEYGRYCVGRDRKEAVGY